MNEYRAPIGEFDFILNHVIDFTDITALDPFAEATPDLVSAILEEAGRFVTGVLSPLNAVGDKGGAELTDVGVTTAPGFKQAYRQYVDGGWNGMAADPEFGGQGMPLTLHTAVTEMADGANMAFMLCSLLNQGAIEALQAHGTDAQKAAYLEKIISGEWTGTMNLTEPQAGSDVGALRCKAEPQEEGHYLISGQKIYITYGDHDMAENIIHLVLARTPGAPAGTKGISLFLVPKFLGDNRDNFVRNDVKAVSLEHKLGIHASPTCVMSFGDEGHCVGYLLGEEMKGMQCMFTMMNSARLGVGVQGVGCGERAYQMAAAYASERIQGQPPGAATGSAIIEHADIRRQLLTMKAMVEAARMICLYNARAIDLSRHHPDPDKRAAQQGLADLLTPLSKAYGSDVGVEVASLGLQVFGGMGYVEETGIAQIYRDSRIAPIYEGTNGIQALDLVGRKLAQDGGIHWQTLLTDIDEFLMKIRERAEMASLSGACEQLTVAVGAARACATFLFAQSTDNMRVRAAGATPFLRLLSMTVGGWLHLKAAVAAQNMKNAGEGDPDFLEMKIITARFYAEQLLPAATGLAEAVMGGDELLFMPSAAQLWNE